ncbi:MAG: methyltransferase domain-containing protein, partial [Acidobacteria bacterium]|nr:methyltransferase domain-containing protein [Acidobacteriota bacterium]
LLDAYLDQFSNGKKLDIEVRVALRLGLYQLLYLDRIPPHAAVNESIRLVQFAKKRSASALVNAILRKAASALPKLEFKDELERLSVETSNPLSLLERWVAQFGIEEARRIAKANNSASQLAFRLLVSRDEFPSAVSEEWRESEYVEGCYSSAGQTKELLTLNSEGKIYFQEEGSQMVAAAVRPPAGGRLLDVCASPGGKTGMILARCAAFCVAGDISFRRAAFLDRNLSRQKVEAEVLQYDAETALPFEDEVFDTILLDAPCSGTGTIRSNPEIRYRVSAKEIERLSAKQKRVLNTATKALKKGGMLVYSTCSLEREENEGVIEPFLIANQGFEKHLPQVPARLVTTDGFARTFPHRDGMDGFFIAALRRI